MFAYVLHILCRLFSRDVGVRVQITDRPKPAGSNTEETLTQTLAQNALYTHYRSKITPSSAMTVQMTAKYSPKLPDPMCGWSKPNPQKPPPVPFET